MRVRYYVIAILLCLPVIVGAQTAVKFGAGVNDTAYNLGHTRFDRTVKLKGYSSADTNKVVGVDAAGLLTLRTKQSPTLNYTIPSDGSSFTAAAIAGRTAIILYASGQSYTIESFTQTGNTITRTDAGGFYSGQKISILFL